MAKTRKAKKSVSLKTQKAGMKNCWSRYLVYKQYNNWYKMSKRRAGKPMNSTEIDNMKKKTWRMSKRRESQRRMPSWLKSLLKDKRYLKTSGAFQRNCYYAIGDINQLKHELGVKEKGILKKRPLIRIMWPKKTRKIRFNSKPVHSQKKIIAEKKKRTQLLEEFTRKHRKSVENNKANNLKRKHAEQLKELEERQQKNTTKLQTKHANNLKRITERGQKRIQNIIKPPTPPSPNITDEELMERFRKLKEHSPPKQKLDEFGLPEV